MSTTKQKTDIQSMSSLDRRILCQGIVQAVIKSGIAPVDWEQLSERGVKVTLRLLKSIDPNERKKTNGKNKSKG